MSSFSSLLKASRVSGVENSGIPQRGVLKTCSHNKFLWKDEDAETSKSTFFNIPLTPLRRKFTLSALLFGNFFAHRVKSNARESRENYLISCLRISLLSLRNFFLFSHCCYSVFVSCNKKQFYAIIEFEEFISIFPRSLLCIHKCLNSSLREMIFMVFHVLFTNFFCARQFGGKIATLPRN